MRRFDFRASVIKCAWGQQRLTNRIIVLCVWSFVVASPIVIVKTPSTTGTLNRYLFATQSNIESLFRLVLNSVLSSHIVYMMKDKEFHWHFFISTITRERRDRFISYIYFSGALVWKTALARIWTRVIGSNCNNNYYTNHNSFK